MGISEDPSKVKLLTGAKASSSYRRSAQQGIGWIVVSNQSEGGARITFW